MLWRFVGNRSTGFVNVFPFLSSHRGDPRKIEPGNVVEREPYIGLAGITSHDFQQLHDPRDRATPKTRVELKAECDALRDWIQAGHLRWSGPPHPFIDSE